MNYKTKIEIPRDWRSVDIAFIEEPPIGIKDIIDVNTYKGYIKSINAIFKPQVSIWSIIKMITIILFLLSDTTTYDDEVEKLIRKINLEIKEPNIYFGHPKDENYVFINLYVCHN